MMDFTYETFKISEKVVKEMLGDRGYIYTANANPKKGFEERDRLEGIATKKTITILVVWYPTDSNRKITVQNITALKDELDSNSYDKAIIITDCSITLKADKTIQVQRNFFEFRTFKETQSNITKHILVPKHRALTSSEKNEVLQKYNTTISNIPKIKLNDPICRWYRFKLKAMIEITRETTNGPEISYRIVIAGG